MPGSVGAQQDTVLGDLDRVADDAHADDVADSPDPGRRRGCLGQKADVGTGQRVVFPKDRQFPTFRCRFQTTVFIGDHRMLVRASRVPLGSSRVGTCGSGRLCEAISVPGSAARAKPPDERRASGGPRKPHSRL